MKTKAKYVLIKDNIYRKIESYDFNESFNMTKKQDDERLGVIKFYDDEIISKVIKRSIDNRFKKILELIASIEESDEDPSQGYLFFILFINRQPVMNFIPTLHILILFNFILYLFFLRLDDGGIAISRVNHTNCG